MSELSRGVRLAYASGQLGLNTVTTLFALHLVFFYADGLGFAAGALSVALVLAQVWDLLLSPLSGHLSDSLRARGVRRRAFLLLAAPPLAAAFALLLNPPHAVAAGGGAALATLLVLLLLFYTARALFEIPYLALLPEITRDYDERTEIASYRQMFGNVGDLLGAMAPVALMAWLGARAAFGAIGLGVAAMLLATALVVARGTREPAAGVAAGAGSAFAAVRATLRSRPYRRFLGVYALAFFATAIPIGLFRFVIKYAFAAESLEPAFFGIYFAGALLFVPIWIRVAARTGKKAAYRITLFGLAGVFPLALVVPASSPWWFAGIMFSSGALLVGFWSLSYAIAADVVDHDERATGVRRAGAFSGVFGLTQKAALGLGLAAASAGLAAIGYEGGAAGAGAAGATGLRVLFGVPPAVLLVAASLWFARFPLTRDTHQETQRSLAGAVAAPAVSGAPRPVTAAPGHGALDSEGAR